MNHSFRVLSIDGGGIRGYFSAYLLQKIQNEFGIVFHEFFDLISGTSTGSIIAAALATGIDINDVVRLYETKGNEIFSRNKLTLFGLLKPTYDSTSLEVELKEFFKGKTLSDTKTRLLIPATDLTNGKVHVFKSKYLDEFTRDPGIDISSAVLASCSAPTYFKPAFVDPYLLADGGLWANNPALVSYVEATGKLQNPKENVKIFSIGTGIGKKYYRAKDKERPWGLLTGWQDKKLIDVILNLQSTSADGMLKLMLGEGYYRINFEQDSHLSLDDLDLLPDLKARADRLFTEQTLNIRNIFKEVVKK